MMKKNKFIELVLINSASLLFILAVINIVAILINTVEKKLNRSERNLSSEIEKSAPVLPKKKEIFLPKILYNLSGEIISLDQNKIIFNAEIIKKDENGEIIKTLESRKAIIISATKFSRLSFIKNSPIETKLEIKDFKKGDYIEAISDKDISNALEFNAMQIRIL